MENNLITIRQLPVIEEQLQAIRDQIISRVNEALQMVVTEDTVKTVKAVRAELRAEYSSLEARRKEVKEQILAPYENFERVYRENAGDIYADADLQLKKKIDEVENGLKEKKRESVFRYFTEYRDSLGIEATVVSFPDAKINVTLSASEKSLKAQAKDFLDGVYNDLLMILTMDHRDEIMTEYRKTHNAAVAVTTVENRFKAIEEERRRREAAEAERAARAAAIASASAAVEAVVQESVPPVTEPPKPEPVTEKIYRVTFTVVGTREQLHTLKTFLTDGGYRYETK